MATPPLRTIRSVILVPAILLLGLAGFWLWIRWGYLQAAPGRAHNSEAAKAFFGWLAILFLITTVASVAWGAAADRRKASFQSAILIDGSALLFFWIGCGTHLIAFWDVLRLYALLAAWGVGALEATRLLLRFIGSAPAIAVSLTIAMILFAGPVTMVPLLRAAANWRAGVQDTLVSAVGITTPLLGCLEAIKASLPIDWPQLPQMYQLSILGQDIARPEPSWWINALTYAVAAALAHIANLISRQRAPSIDDQG